ncbi:unnamed protein product [Calypogeia fissa]
MARLAPQAPQPLPAQPPAAPPLAPKIAQAPGETAVNSVALEGSESDGGSSSGWEFIEEMPGMETQEEECFKVSTRSTKQERRKEKI